jgi:hypothetical protein
VYLFFLNFILIFFYIYAGNEKKNININFKAEKVRYFINFKKIIYILLFIYTYVRCSDEIIYYY